MKRMRLLRDYVTHRKRNSSCFFFFLLSCDFNTTNPHYIIAALLPVAAVKHSYLSVRIEGKKEDQIGIVNEAP